jgi:transcription antitermination factor NusG
VIALDDKPVPLGDEMINLIRRKVERLNPAGGWTNAAFQPGETVRIKDGPLTGILAVFDGPSKPSERVRVLLDFLGRTARARVPVGSLEKVQSRAYLPATKRPRRTRGKGRRLD